MQMNFSHILEKAADEAISPDEALFLFHESENYVNANKLFEAASGVRDREMGRTFRWSGGIASILPCKLNPLCSYCSYWDKPRDQLTMDEILTGVRYIEDHGLTNFHLSGGTTLGDDGKEVLDIVRNIRAVSKSELTVNVGAALSEDTIVELKSLGVARIGSSFETINPKLFKDLKAGDSLEAKKRLAETIDATWYWPWQRVACRPDDGRFEVQGLCGFHVLHEGFKNLESVYVSRFLPVQGYAHGKPSQVLCDGGLADHRHHEAVLCGISTSARPQAGAMTISRCGSWPAAETISEEYT